MHGQAKHEYEWVGCGGGKDYLTYSVTDLTLGIKDNHGNNEKETQNPRYLKSESRSKSFTHSEWVRIIDRML
jgi:hypothetical protein